MNSHWKTLLCAPLGVANLLMSKFPAAPVLPLQVPLWGKGGLSQLPVHTGVSLLLTGEAEYRTQPLHSSSLEGRAAAAISYPAKASPSLASPSPIS